MVFIYGIGFSSILSNTDDLSLYYNMVADIGKMDPNARKISAKHKDSKPATGEGLITQSL